MIVHGDQIEVCKIMHVYEWLNKYVFFPELRTRAELGDTHRLALVKRHSRLDIRKYTFYQKVVNDWYRLPEECINGTSVQLI